MSSTYTTSLTLTQIGNGEQSGTWGTTTNTNWQLIEDSVAGVAQVTVSGSTGATLSVANGTTDQSRNAVIVVTGSISTSVAIVAPLVKKVYIISNQTSGGFAITIGATTGSTVSIANGLTTLVYCDGTNFFAGITGFTGGNLSITGTINATGTITGANFATSGGVPQLAGGTTGQIPYQTATNTTGFTPAPTTGSYLTWNGSAYAWSTGSVTTATNLAGGSANSIPYQTSSGSTSFLTPSGGTPLTLQYNGSTLNWAAAGAVSSFSGGSTGLTPSVPTTGSIVLAGTLAVANGGTGSATKNFVDITTDQSSIAGNKTFTTGAVIKGVTDGSSAAAGYVGELISASASNVSSPNNVATNIASITLTAGDWDLWGSTDCNNNPNIIAYLSSISTVSGVIQSSGGIYLNGGGSMGPVAQLAPGYTVSFSGASRTYYLVAFAAYTGTTALVNGSIFARRVR